MPSIMDSRSASFTLHFSAGGRRGACVSENLQGRIYDVIVCHRQFNWLDEDQVHLNLLASAGLEDLEVDEEKN